jgi:Mpv17 / PMP22 family
MLDSTIPPTVEPFTATNGIKVVIDQFVQAPVFTVLIFVFLGVLEGKSAAAIQNQINKDYQETIVANWKLWVPATIVNIGFVPPLYRVLYLNCVFFFWSIYLSLVLNKNEEPEA